MDLDFSRYGETLFEVLFAGGRMAGGGNVISEGKKLDTSVSICTLGRQPHSMLGGRQSMVPTARQPEVGVAHLQVLAAEPIREAIMPYMEAIKGLVRCAVCAGSSCAL